MRASENTENTCKKWAVCWRCFCTAVYRLFSGVLWRMLSPKWLKCVHNTNAQMLVTNWRPHNLMEKNATSNHIVIFFVMIRACVWWLLSTYNSKLWTKSGGNCTNMCSLVLFIMCVNTEANFGGYYWMISSARSMSVVFSSYFACSADFQSRFGITQDMHVFWSNQSVIPFKDTTIKDSWALFCLQPMRIKYWLIYTHKVDVVRANWKWWWQRCWTAYMGTKTFYFGQLSDHGL